MDIDLEAQPYVARLVDEIAKMVQDDTVLAAFRAVPRHRFLMDGFYLYDGQTHQNNHITPETTDLANWLDKAYVNEYRATVLRDGEPISSSSQPSLMAQMIFDLDIKSGMRVLEIGTGTGYNAALLAYLVGESGEVVTIDVQPLLTDRAAALLASAVGGPVSIHTGNGLLGVPEKAPYDRIIVTAGCPYVPPAWVEQLRVGGKLIMNIGTRGALLLLEKQEHEAKGQILKTRGYFMSMVNTDPQQDELLDDIDLPALCSWDFIFFCTLAMKGARVSFPQPVPDEPLRLYFQSPESANGIILQQADAQVKLIIKGVRGFAEQALEIIRQWQAMGKPQASDYVFEITGDGRQFFRLPSAQVSFEVPRD